MTEIQWFAFVILPAMIAVAVVVAVRVFERFNPVPVADDPRADDPVKGTGISRSRPR